GMDRFLAFLLFIKGLHSISINSSLLLIDEDFPLHSDLPIKICPKSVRLIDGDSSGLFSLHPLSNSSCLTLRLNSPLDADIRSSDVPFVSFSLLFSESSKSRANLDIQLIDVNDNAPTLIDPPGIVRIPEGARRGSLITTFTSFDPDSGIFGLPRYWILPKQSGVSIRRGGSDGKGGTTAELIMEEGVEMSRSLTLSIQDGDPSGEGLTHHILWNFTLVPSSTNVNTPPQFSSIVRQSIMIPLDVPIGSTLFSLREDQDQNERIYAIEENVYLRVDKRSGEIILMKRTENEEEKTFRVKVTDPSTRLFTQQNLRVIFSVRPIPIPSSFHLHPLYNFSIQEETMSNLPIAALPPGVSLTISSLPPNIPLIVDGGNLRVGKIDRDLITDNLLSFRIRAVNSSGESLGESEIWISVQDINDYFPIFSQTNYTFGLTKEGADEKSGGVFIGRIRVGDDDATSPFNTVNLYTRDPRLRVENDGSVFTTKEIKDEEMVVRIFATDGGTPNKTSSTIVQVRMIDEEKITVSPEQKSIDWNGSGDGSKKYSVLRMSSPRYTQDEVNEWIQINEKNGSILLISPVPSTQIRLFLLIKGDRDESPKSLLLLFPHNDVLSFSRREYTVFVSRPSNQSIIALSLLSRTENVTYSMEEFPSSLPFIVDDEGRIYWKSMNEFPPSNWLNGTIVVKDAEGREDRREDRVPINFHFTKNHIPQFSSSSFVVFLSIPSSRGKLLPLPSPPAIDLDPQDPLQYSIIDSSGLFSVNSSTGRVNLANEMTEEGTLSFSLVVKDNGGMIPFHEQSIKVEVIARKDGDPIGMETNLQSLSIHFNSQIGSIVTKLEYNGSAKLISTDRHFRVNERRELIVNENVNKLANQKVCAHLQSGAQSIPFCVNILDNSSLPIVEFPLEGSIHSVEEGRMNDRVIQIKLSPSSPPATFRLQNQTHSEWDWLSLSPSGLLSTLRPLDYEKRSSIPIRIGVCSLEGKCFPLQFILVVKDANDHCPILETKSIEVSINENESKFPLKILTLPQVKDGDFDPLNRHNCYTIDSPLFFFHPSSSFHIFTNTSFDREITPVIIFNVIVFDCDLKCQSSTHPINSTLAVTLKINDMNDSIPRFSSRVKHLTVVGGSNIPAGTQMALFTASDPDDEELIYSIKGSIRTLDSVVHPSDAPFFINSSSGQLITRSTLPSPSYSFILQVNDTAFHQDEMDVHITTVSLDQQTEIFFEIPFEYFLQKEYEITNHLSTGSSFTAVIDKCRQSSNSTVVLLHFMDSSKVANIRKAIENLNRSPSPAVIELKSIYKMRLQDVTSEPHENTITRLILMVSALILFISCLIFLLILFRSKRDQSKSPPSSLTTQFGPHAVKRSPYWSEISAPIVTKTTSQSLQSTEL
ncbi:hypothetical protein PENTCL1PPCAC_17921, partial [Pristionchus entomophagus]